MKVVRAIRYLIAVILVGVAIYFNIFMWQTYAPINQRVVVTLLLVIPAIFIQPSNKRLIYGIFSILLLVLSPVLMWLTLITPFFPSESDRHNIATGIADLQHNQPSPLSYKEARLYHGYYLPSSPAARPVLPFVAYETTAPYKPHAIVSGLIPHIVLRLIATIFLWYWALVIFAGLRHKASSSQYLKKSPLKPKNWLNIVWLLVPKY